MSNNKQTAVEWLVGELKNMKIGNNQLLINYENLDYLIEQAKEMEKEQKGYSEEDVREMLFMALHELQTECCTTHTKDSIVRKVLKTFNSK